MASSLVRSIDGPIISVTDLAPHRALFEGVFGLVDRGGGTLDESAVERLWGVRGRRAETRLLETPGTSAGVLFVRFEPISPIAIRAEAGPTDSGALKVIDFATADFSAAQDALAQAGFPFSAPPATYAVASGSRFTEGHLNGPDAITCAVLAFHDDPLGRFARVTDRLFSEIVGVSAPVDDPASAEQFYAALGLGVVYEYAIGDERFGAMIGKREQSVVRGINYGLSEREVMIGIIHYGLPAGAASSLRERARLPNRGLAALRLVVSSVTAAAAACQQGGGTVLAPPAEVTLPPWGTVRSLSVQAPHGVVHHFIER
ncbi:MAG: hypothetical protein RMM58_00660 [Chloroflexota bacterium]|nr:hypothetical protein [Dehalococcoidia bacterium]MDW8252369.1 hypothetical protein [Chloroflexota bacterium]